MEKCQSSEGTEFLSKYKSESSIVEFSVSKISSTYYQYCHLDFSVAHGGKNDVSEKHCPWSVAENTQTFFQNTTFFFFLSVHLVLSAFECSQSGGLPGAGAAMFHSLICLFVVEAERQLCTSD